MAPHRSARPDLVDAVRRTAEMAPQRKAVGLVSDPDNEHEGSLTSYSQIDEDARRVAAVLQELGIPAGSRVLLLFPSSVAFVAGFLGTLYAGMIAVPAPLPTATSSARRRVGLLARDCGAAAVLTVTATRAEVQEWAGENGFADTPVLDVEALPPGVGADAWTEVPRTPGTVALLQYTSGSTGHPKGVMVTHRNITENAELLCRHLGLPEGARFGGWAPMHHDMGLFGLLTPALLTGSRCLMMDSFTFLRRPYLWLRMVERYGITFSPGPNFAYDHCVRRVSGEEMARLDLSGWLRACNGSEPIQAGTLRRFTEAFAPTGFRPESMTACYGLAEHTVFVSSRLDGTKVLNADAELLERHLHAPAQQGRPSRELVSCGPVAAGEVLIAAPDTGLPVGPGRIGEIRLRGGSVAHGYWEKPEATARTFLPAPAGDGPGDGPGVTLRTGDLGMVHDGELYITGRIKELLIVHGRNLHPHDIEHELRERHAGLGAVGAVFTVPEGPDGAETVVVSHEIEGRPSEEAAAELVKELRGTLAREFGIHAGGVVLVGRGRISRTTSGKVERNAVRASFLDGSLVARYADRGARRLAGSRVPQGPVQVVPG
ncbi:fatty acyl-AMP ligase [Streptomyces sp. NBC_00838]|uniref:fatty acyl-AMP ligase n=1 Tax=Streptomyces sp. NBC_00838 TaxID=2903680 RepID=UPI00386FE512|nr:fatty acyl-AMP ligase [Streptomyces sp. NBC_00838]